MTRETGGTGVPVGTRVSAGRAGAGAGPLIAGDRGETGPGAHERVAATGSTVAVALLLVALLAVFALSVGCGDDQPPDITVAALGAAVGDAKLDDLDFTLLLATYASESYRSDVEPEQSNYQLYLAAKAADLGLNKAGPGNVEVTKQIDGKAATFRFGFAQKEGLFAVADVGSVEIALVRTDATQYPWRIEAITLAR